MRRHRKVALRRCNCCTTEPNRYAPAILAGQSTTVFGESFMYAIVFDLDTEILSQRYHVRSWENAYSDIRAFLERRLSVAAAKPLALKQA